MILKELTYKVSSFSLFDDPININGLGYGLGWEFQHGFHSVAAVSTAGFCEISIYAVRWLVKAYLFDILYLFAE